MGEKFKLDLKTILTILVVVALGLLIFNQILEYRFKAVFLGSPCKLCGDLNPEVAQCIELLNSPRESYWNNGTWTDPFNETTQVQIEIIK